jgi:hypothetical protein
MKEFIKERQEKFHLIWFAEKIKNSHERRSIKGRMKRSFEIS